MKACRKCKQPLTAEELCQPKGYTTCKQCQRKASKRVSNRKRAVKVQEKKPLAMRSMHMSSETWQCLEAMLPDLRRFCSWLALQVDADKYNMDMQDILQESIYNMLTAANQPPLEALKPWALRIIRNAAVLDRRQDKTVAFEQGQQLLLADEQEELDWFQQLEEQLPALLVKLPKKQQLYLLDRTAGLSLQEIADKHQASLGAVKSIIHAGKLNLRTLLQTN